MPHPGPDHGVTFTAPRGLWWLNLFTAVLLVFLILLVGGIGVGLIITAYPIAGVLLVLLAAFLVVVLRQVIRNGWGLGRWRVALAGDRLRLDLPAARSLSRRLAPVARDLPLADIAAVETRCEAYPTFGMTNMNRSYALRLNDGSMLMLGEDRGLGSGLATTYVGAAVEAIAARGIEIRDLGMSEGRGGILAVARVRPPDWDAPAISAPRAETMQRGARRTGKLAFGAAVIVLIAVALQQFF